MPGTSARSSAGRSRTGAALERCGAWENEHWATEYEARADILGLYWSVCEHSDATIDALPIDAPGHVPWWPRPDVKLFNVMVHILNETTRHAGHADILREQLDRRTGTTAAYEEAIDAAAREGLLHEGRTSRQGC